MLKSISELGTVLNKTEQIKVNGGQIQCPRGQVLVCTWHGCWCESEEEKIKLPFEH